MSSPYRCSDIGRLIMSPIQHHHLNWYNVRCPFVERNCFHLPYCWRYDQFSHVPTLGSLLTKAKGQYHWVHCLTPVSYQATASWFTGWISIGGQLVFSASAAFAAGLQLQALITLNNPNSYTPTRWQGMLFYWFILAYSTAVNIWGSKVLPHANTTAGKRFLNP